MASIRRLLPIATILALALVAAFSVRTANLLSIIPGLLATFAIV